MTAAFFSALLVVASAGEAPTPSVPLAIGELFPDNMYLVEAVSVKPNTFRISHVYVGPASLKDQPFIGEIQIGSGLRMRGHETWQIGTGEKCLCWVVKMDGADQIGLFRAVAPEVPATKLPHAEVPPAEAARLWEILFDFTTFFFPVKKSDQAFDRLLAVAQFYEKIYRAKDGDRMAIIDRHLHNKDVAAHALFWLNHCQKTEIQTYLRRWALDESVPVHLQILAAMSTSLSADERKKAMTRWFREEWRNPPCLAGFELPAEYVLWTLVHERQYAAPELVNLLIIGLLNPERSEEFKRSLLRRVQDEFFQDAARARRNAALAQLMDVLNREQPKATQIAAVRMLEVFDPVNKPLNEEELAKLRAILPKLSDEAAEELLLGRLQVGMKISEVFQFGPAWGAGLHEFDVIIGVGGKPVRSFDELAAALADANGAVDLVVVRDSGKREKVSVTPRAGKIGVSVEEQRPVRSMQIP